MPRINIPGFLKPTHSEEGDDAQRSGRSDKKANDLELNNSEILLERDGRQTLNNIMAATKNPSTVFKPPFGTCAEEHHSKLGEHAQHLWKYNKITDLIVKLEGKQYPCHKTVLSCYSKYFKELLFDQKKTVHTINLRVPYVTNTAFEVLLTYMYTSDLHLTCQNIGDVFTAARRLGIDGALLLCTNILSGNSKHDVYSVYVYVTAKKQGLEECAAKALKIMTRRFEHIVGTPEFLDLDFFQVREYLSQDVLATRSEVIVYLAALKWLSVKYLEREEFAVDLISCIRFQMMTLNEVLACFSPPLLPGILELKQMKDIMLEATCYVAAATVNEEKRFEKFSGKPRKYLFKREPIILWDPSIFDPDRHTMYIEEMAATKIQAAFRGYKARKSVEADKAAGILKADISQFKPALKTNLASLDEFEIPKDESDDTYIGSRSDTRIGLRKTERKSTPSDENDKELNSNEEEKQSKQKVKHQSKFSDTKESDEEDVDLVSSARVSVDLSRSSSIETLVEHVNDLAENTEIKKYTSDTAVDMSSEAFHTSPNKHETIHKIYTISTIEEDRRKSFKSSSEESVTSTGNLSAYILATGGLRSDGVEGVSNSKKMFIYNVAENKWKKFGTMEEGRHHHCLVLLNDEVYLIGGCNPERAKHGKMISDKHCFKLNLKSRIWSKISKMRHSRMYHGVAEMDGKIYAIGGKNHKDKLLCSVEVYNPQTNKWEELDTCLETPTMGCGVCVHQKKIWIIGGMVQENDGSLRIVDEVKLFDPNSKSWSNSIRQLPAPRAFSTAVSFENEIFVVGGTSKKEYSKTDHFVSISDVLFYNEEEKRWILAATLPYPKHFVNANIIGSSLYVLGGLTSYQRPTVDEIFVFDKKTGKWNSGAPLPEPLCGFASLSILEAQTK